MTDLRPFGIKQQQGTMLLLVLLLLTLGAAIPMLHSLNAATARQERAQQTARALARAKDALLSFAASYPENKSDPDAISGPGYLPCPDLLNDGGISVRGTDASCDPHNLGRFPWAYLDVEDLRDGSGERLWYSVASGYRSTGRRKQIPLNSETRSRLTMDGRDDIAAVLIAPGPPLPAQGRDSSRMNAVENYLEGDNAGSPPDDRFVSHGAGTEPFNDVLLPITHRELAQAMERRALGEIRRRLLRYREVFGKVTGSAKEVYPLLSRMRNPHIATLTVSGQADTGSTGMRLHDSNRDFKALGVVPGSVVFNKHDGSYGLVSKVAKHAVEVRGWVGGSVNQLAMKNKYEITAIPLLDGAVAASDPGTDGTVTGAVDFSDAGIKQGDAIEKADDASRGTVARVREDQLDTDDSNSGSMRFRPGDRYRVITHGGQADKDSSGAASESRLHDSRPGRVFAADAAHLVQNLAEGTFAYVKSMDSASTLALATPPKVKLFADDNPYLVSTFLDSPAKSESEAWLPIHRVGDPFPSDFDISWTTSGLNVPVTLPPDNKGRIWKAFTDASFQTFHNTTTKHKSACVWYAANIAHCGFWLESYLSGRATAGSPTQLSDATRIFDYSGAEQGDLLILPDRPGQPQGIISQVAGNTITLYSLENNTGPVSVQPGDSYRVKLATKVVNGRAEAGSGTEGNGLNLRYNNPAFAAATDVDDAYVIATDELGSFVGAGPVASRDPSGSTLRLQWLRGGARNKLQADDRYAIRWGFIEHRFVNVSIQGEATPALQDERRVRRVRSDGPVRQTAPIFTLRDYAGDGKLLGVGEVGGTVGTGDVQIDVQGIQLHFGPVAGIAETTGSLKLRDKDRNFSDWGVRPGDWVEDLKQQRFGRVRALMADPHALDLDGLTVKSGSAYRIYADLPLWFTVNGWDRLTYMAEADSVRPVPKDGVSSASYPCLKVTSIRPDDCPQVLAIATGDVLTRADVEQNRAAPALANFMEGENTTVHDRVFVGTRVDPASNDQLRVVE